jgi:hypothetical protein
VEIVVSDAAMTYGTGNIGSELAGLSASSGSPVRALARPEPAAPSDAGAFA